MADTNAPGVVYPRLLEADMFALLPFALTLKAG